MKTLYDYGKGNINLLILIYLLELEEYEFRSKNWEGNVYLLLNGILLLKKHIELILEMKYREILHRLMKKRFRISTFY